MIELFMCMQKDIVSPDLDCIAEEVIKINETTKFRTFMCCCGHGVYPKTIIVVNPISGFFFDYPSGTGMREHIKEPFYERDALGFLYNKETMEYYQKHPEERRKMKVGITFEKEGDITKPIKNNLLYTIANVIECDLIIKKHVIVNRNVIKM